MAKWLVKVDKNGTKYWANDVCQRCGGTGGSDAWAYTGWTCYECGGSGKASKPEIWKEYTEEYAQKLEAQRKKRQEKQMQERRDKADATNAEFLERRGFNIGGYAFAILDAKYEEREELKQAGCRYTSALGWYSANDIEGRETMKILADDAFDKNGCGEYTFEQYMLDAIKAEKITRENAKAYAEKENAFYGQDGEKVSLTLTYTGSAHFDTCYGTTYVHNFENEKGNAFVWKTGNGINSNRGDAVTISGTIKEHNEYRGIKQTVLTRCKIA